MPARNAPVTYLPKINGGQTEKPYLKKSKKQLKKRHPRSPCSSRKGGVHAGSQPATHTKPPKREKHENANTSCEDDDDARALLPTSTILPSRPFAAAVKKKICIFSVSLRSKICTRLRVS